MPSIQTGGNIVAAVDHHPTANGTTRIQIGGNNCSNNYEQSKDEREEAQQRHELLLLQRRSAFIPEAEDGKQFISKDESEVLRDSIISLNRPRISRPWFDQPPATILSKKSAANNNNGSPRSNSSSGCSSDPQSGPASPVSSKCSSESSTVTTTTTIVGSVPQLQPKNAFGRHQQNASGGTAAETVAVYDKQSSPHMLSASLVSKVGGPSSSSNDQNKTSSSSSALMNRQLPAVPSLLLKQKEFPSYQRRHVLMPSAQQQQRKSGSGVQAKAYQQQQKLAKMAVPPPVRNKVNPSPSTDEVEELSRAAQKQMAILEELEFEDRERKTRITGQLAKGGGTNDSSSSDSSRESTATRLSSSSSASSASTASPSVYSAASSSMDSAEWAAETRKSAATKQQNGNNHRLPQQLLMKELQRHHHQQQQQQSSGSEKQQRPKLTAPSLHDDYLNPLLKNNNSSSSNARQQEVAGAGVEDRQRSNGGVPNLECKACGQMITDVILQALGSSFHPACFRCHKCGKCLDGIPFAVEQSGAVICMEDYERHFVPHCQRCKQPISAVNEFGQVVRVIIRDQEFHIQCYCCEGCGMQLSNEEQTRCYPLGDHLLCRRCHTLWRRMGALDSEAAVSDL